MTLFADASQPVARMSLATLSRYDSDQLTEFGEQAVVVGGSMAGLLTARVLADAFERVIIVEKDSLPDERATRRGTPQAEHLHIMQEAGRKTLEDFFPGYSEDLIQQGAVLIDMASDLRVYDEGDVLAGGSNRVPMYCASRPLFEQVTRRHVTEMHNIRVRDECQVTQYLTGDSDTRITGVEIRNECSDIELLSADLVVDATGRTSRMPNWLADHGYSSPPTDEVEIGVEYGTVRLNRPADDRRALDVLPSPPRKRGATVFPIEDDQWIMTLYGLHGDHPPADFDGYVQFASGLPLDGFEDILTEYDVVSDGITKYPYPASQRCRYWELERFPDGLLVIGDAIASFNPIYGQGMSVAALEALQLHHALAESGTEDLALRFFDRAETVVDEAWSLSVGSDFQFPETTGPKPPGTDIMNWYESRLMRKAQSDGTLGEAYARVAAMEKPPTSLLRPSVVWRVLKPGT